MSEEKGTRATCVLPGFGTHLCLTCNEENSNWTPKKGTHLPDPVNHPAHKIEVIDVIEAYPDLGWNLHNVIKYVLRHKHKGGNQDLEKAANYLHRELHGNWQDENGSVYKQAAGTETKEGK